MDNLRKHGIYVINWCFLCKKNGESVTHLFLHCKVAKILWNETFGRMAIAWVMPLQVVYFLACWKGFKGSKRIADL